MPAGSLASWWYLWFLSYIDVTLTSEHLQFELLTYCHTQFSLVHFLVVCGEESKLCVLSTGNFHVSLKLI